MDGQKTGPDCVDVREWREQQEHIRKFLTKFINVKYMNISPFMFCASAEHKTKKRLIYVVFSSDFWLFENAFNLNAKLSYVFEIMSIYFYANMLHLFLLDFFIWLTTDKIPKSESIFLFDQIWIVHFQRSIIFRNVIVTISVYFQARISLEIVRTKMFTNIRQNRKLWLCVHTQQVFEFLKMWFCDNYLFKLRFFMQYLFRYWILFFSAFTKSIHKLNEITEIHDIGGIFWLDFYYYIFDVNGRNYTMWEDKMTDNGHIDTGKGRGSQAGEAERSG